MDRLDMMEIKVNNLVIETLVNFKELLIEFNIKDDRQITLTLFYFLNTLVQNGWKNQKPSDIYKNAIEICQATNQDFAIPLVTK
jgi:hypothetical protein